MTLVELLVALPLSAIILGYLSYYVHNTMRMYNFDELKSDMVQNAHYAAQRLSETLTETGSCMPSQTAGILLVDEIAGTPPRPKLTRRYNPDCGAIHTVTADRFSDSIWVDTLGEFFSKADSIVVTSSKTTVRWRRPIVRVLDFANSLRADTLIVDAKDDVMRKDVIFGHKTETWSVTPAGQLYIYTTNSADTSMILAENIDTLRVTFDNVAADGTIDTVTDWLDMENGTVYVVARTQRTVPGSSQYIRETFSTRFRFKSKIQE